jgi:hypothetical protein
MKRFFLPKPHIQNPQQGITLLLAILILSSIMAVSFSLATILFIEIRTSGDLLRTEPAYYGADAVAEEAIYKVKRQVPDGSFAYTTALGNVKLNNPAPIESSVTTPIYQDTVQPNTNFSNTSNHYILAPSSLIGGSGYGKITITYLNSGNSDNLTVYLCEYDPNLPYDPNGGLPTSYKTIVCTDPNSNEYWTASGKGYALNTSINPSHTWTLNPGLQQELIIFDSGATAAIHAQIEAFGSDGTTPLGIPYLNKKAVDINAENQGLDRKLRVEIPK